jgi:hypothetical protein
VPMSWPTEYAWHLDVRTTSIYPLPKMSPDRALGEGRTSQNSPSTHFGEYGQEEEEGPGLFAASAPMLCG